ncbi:MAG: hypothetical protein OWV35_02310 [Firmicutes bacterium]|nr:hypothetical protein [Bacillota bacterium]
MAWFGKWEPAVPMAAFLDQVTFRWTGLMPLQPGLPDPGGILGFVPRDGSTWDAWWRARMAEGTVRDYQFRYEQAVSLFRAQMAGPIWLRLHPAVAPSRFLEWPGWWGLNPLGFWLPAPVEALPGRVQARLRYLAHHRWAEAVPPGDWWIPEMRGWLPDPDDAEAAVLAPGRGGDLALQTRFWVVPPAWCMHLADEDEAGLIRQERLLWLVTRLDQLREDRGEQPASLDLALVVGADGADGSSIWDLTDRDWQILRWLGVHYAADPYAEGEIVPAFAREEEDPDGPLPFLDDE